MRVALKAAERDVLGAVSAALAALADKGKAAEAAGGFAVDLKLPDEIEVATDDEARP